MLSQRPLIQRTRVSHHYPPQHRKTLLRDPLTLLPLHTTNPSRRPYRPQNVGAHTHCLRYQVETSTPRIPRR